MVLGVDNGFVHFADGMGGLKQNEAPAGAS
jgi:hypothetical protein